MAKCTPKIIYYRDETAQKLIAGINTVADVVKVGGWGWMGWGRLEWVGVGWGGWVEVGGWVDGDS